MDAPARRVVRRIDHIFVSVDDPHGAFEMLRDRLGLVVTLPIVDWGPFTSGSFNLGNLYLEVLRAQPGFPKAATGALEVNGLAFEPEPLDDAVRDLDRRGIEHSPPIPMVLSEEIEPPESPFDAQVPPGSPAFTNVLLPRFLGDNAFVFCCETNMMPVSTLRERLRQQLDETPERPLAIDSLAEVTVGAKDFDAARRRWQTLLDPLTDDEPGLWRFTDGPALRLVESDRDAAVGLKLGVESLERAERYLKDQDMLASSLASELVISPESVEGLKLTLVG